jgi:hypothetical protein
MARRPERGKGPPLPPWRERHGGAPAQIAREIYDRRRFETLPVLDGALEDAGCWALDLVLGKPCAPAQTSAYGWNRRRNSSWA